jgi:hypothetical protein
MVDFKLEALCFVLSELYNWKTGCLKVGNAITHRHLLAFLYSYIDYNQSESGDYSSKPSVFLYQARHEPYKYIRPSS